MRDGRGFFARTFCKKEFAGQGLDFSIVQCNISYNRKKGTLRGMHYQEPPYEEAKLVSCPRGSIFDVIIDLRAGSPTHGEWIGETLSDSGHRLLYIPGGFAHGYQTLEDDTTVLYQMSEPHRGDRARGVRWSDEAFGIKWPLAPSAISDRDMHWALLRSPRISRNGAP